jgi:hypothetical protein
MDKFIKDHLKHVTTKELEEFRAGAFIPFAHSYGTNGNIDIGVDAFGRYIVRHNGDETIFNSPTGAVEMYHRLVKGEHVEN